MEECIKLKPRKKTIIIFSGRRQGKTFTMKQIINYYENKIKK